MLLKNLIKNIPINKKNILISGISINSKKIKKNYIFFAIRGNDLNGEKFIPQAIQKGASVIVCSKNCKTKTKKNVLVIKTGNIRQLLSEVASKFYPLKPKNIIAVTGTNGKTSVADIFYQILSLNNIPAATIGTLGIKCRGKIIKSNLTSPDTISLHKYLYQFKKKKIDNVIIEASSHGLYQKRLHNIKFKAGVFTNFTQDHLDYHKTMRSYLDAKLILFKEILGKKTSIISNKEIKPFEKLKLIANKKSLKIIDISKKLEKLKDFSKSYDGGFKIKNLAMAIEAVKLCKIKEKSIYKSLKKIKDVNGRLELVKKFQNDIKVFVDYAHTPDALAETLKSLKQDFGSNISIVFGCGGERDKKKRPLMAAIANNNCKKIYVTDDNPRRENPQKIRIQILKYLSKNKAFNIGKREQAIKKAIQNAEPGEIILVAGKGHEEKQIYKNKTFNVSDKKIIRKLSFKKNIRFKKNSNLLQNKLILRELTNKNNPVNFNGISIDTRTIKRNNLFLAIKGKHNDGNNFVEEAIKKGAGCVVSSNTKRVKNKKIIKVKNAISFLNRFGNLKRRYSHAKIITITGSAGKTSLKNLIKDLLLDFGKTHFSPKSYNNHLGVPISLSNLSFEDKFGVFEVGMSKAGEINNLTKLIKPQIAIITNIGEAHIENFKNINGIAKAKSEIIKNITPGGTIILNRDDKFFNFLKKKAKKYNLNICTFGKHTDSKVQFQKIDHKDKKSKILVRINNRKLNFEIGDLNIYNVLAALAVFKELKIDFSKILHKFKGLGPSDGRGKKYIINRYKKKFKFIDESYNANPLSVKNAIKKLSLIKKENFKKYLILGDMLELGSKSRKFHEDLSQVINNSDIDKVFIKGKKTLFTYKHINKDKRGNILQNIEDIDFSLSKMISNNDYLMIKGSNATGLNNFSKRMIKET